MDTIEKLIKALEETKVELNKGTEIIRPDKGYGKIIGTGMSKPINMVTPTAPAAPAAPPSNPKGPKTPSANPHDPHKPNYDKVIMKEELMCSANGQWSLQKDSKDPKLAPKEVKIKELQSKIDNKTYKPDASKIAVKMLKKTPNDASAAAPPANGVSDMAKEEVGSHSGYTVHHMGSKDGESHQYSIKDSSGNSVGHSHVEFDKRNSPIPHTSMSPSHEKHGEALSEVIHNHAGSMKMLKEELSCSTNGQWNLMGKADKPKINFNSKPKINFNSKPSNFNSKPSKAQHAAANSGSAHPTGNADHPSTLSIRDVKKLVKEELTHSKNGQWNLNKAQFKSPYKEIPFKPSSENAYTIPKQEVHEEKAHDHAYKKANPHLTHPAIGWDSLDDSEKGVKLYDHLYDKHQESLAHWKKTGKAKVFKPEN